MNTRTACLDTQLVHGNFLTHIPARITKAILELWVCPRENKLNGADLRKILATENYIFDFVSVRKKHIIKSDGTSFHRRIWNKN